MASDFDLVVGGAGKADTLNADPYLPGGGAIGGGGGADLVPVEATAAGAMDGPGFTWPDDMQLDTVDGGVDQLGDDPLEASPPLGAGAADGAGFTFPEPALDTVELDDGAPDDGGAPHMCGTMPPTTPDDGGTPDEGWAGELDDSGGDPAAGGSWNDTIDGGEPPMTLDGLDEIVPYEMTESGDTIGLADDVGGEPSDWSDVMPYEVTAMPYDDGTVQAQGDDGDTDDDRGGCGDDGDGDDDAQEQGCHAGGGDGGGAGDGSGNGDGNGGGHGGCGDDDDAPADDQIRGGDEQFDPMSWNSTVTATPNPQLGISYDRPAHAGDVNTFAPPQAAQAAHGLGADRIVDWAFSPGGPVAGAVGNDVAQNLWGFIDRAGAFLRR